MKHIITSILFVIALCTACDTQAVTYQPKVSTSTIIICRDTTIWRARPLDDGRQFLICKGVKVTFNDTLRGFHNDTFVLMEYAELTFDSTPNLGAARMIGAAPWSKIFLNAFNPAIYCDSTVYVSRSSFYVHPEDWDTLAGGEYFDFSLWPNQENPCCNARTSHVSKTRTTPFEVYPNPAKDVIHLRTANGCQEPIQLTLLDIHGKQVAAKTWNTGSSQDLQIAAKSGIYFLVMRTSSGTNTTKIMVE
jgi:hypothetical protein